VSEIRRKNSIFLLIIVTIFLTMLPCKKAFASDKIDISLNTTFTDKSYMPMETVDYVLTVHNEKGAAWVRVKIGCSEYNIDTEFTEEALHFTDDWIKRGGYWYYTKKVPTSTSINVIEGVTLPDMTRVMEGAYVRIEATAEAIQFQGITPDFSDDESWDNAKIEDSDKSVTHFGDSDGGCTLYRYKNPVDNPKQSIGHWVPIDVDNKMWKYRDDYGNYCNNGFYYLYNPYSLTGNYFGWYCFDSNGYLISGWIRADVNGQGMSGDETTWLYAYSVSDGDLGHLVRGWHYDTDDSFWYYMNPKTYIMVSGWNLIDGKEYYFTKYQEPLYQSWFWNVSEKLPFGRWIYERVSKHPYGSLYQNEVTPDGFRTDMNGVKIGN